MANNNTNPLYSLRTTSKFPEDVGVLLSGNDFEASTVGYAHTGAMCASDATGINQVDHYTNDAFDSSTIAHEVKRTARAAPLAHSLVAAGAQFRHVPRPARKLRDAHKLSVLEHLCHQDGVLLGRHHVGRQLPQPSRLHLLPLQASRAPPARVRAPMLTHPPRAQQ
jgi:hypothetical protein